MSAAVDYAVLAYQAVKRAKTKGLPSEWCDQLYEWVDWMLINRGLSGNTAANYVQAVTSWMEYLQSVDGDIGNASAVMVNGWQRAEYVERHNGAASRSLSLCALRQFYDWRDMNGMPGNPAKLIKQPRVPKRLPQKFTRDQLRAILGAPDREKAIGVRDFAILLLFLNTGARRSDVVSLDINHMVPRSKSGVVKFTGKGNKERMVPFEGPVVDSLHAWLLMREQFVVPGELALFVGLRRNKGQALGRCGLGDVLNRALKTAGIKKLPGDPYGLHRIRSSYATALYDAGKRIEEIQYLLGHDDINTTRQYIAISERQLQQRLPASFTEDLLGDKKHDTLPAYARGKIGPRIPSE